MNDPLKHKLFSIYGQLLEPKHLKEAWYKVKANKGAQGIDEVTIKEFEKNLDENIQNLADELRAKTYKPTPVRRVYIPKKNGKKRPLGVPSVRDRIVQQALVQAVEPFFEANVFHDNSCGFRPNRGAQTALEKIICRLDLGYDYIYDFDIKGFFDHIPHKNLMKVLNKYISDGSVLNLIYKWLKAGYMEDGVYYVQNEGQPQGGVISPLLANIYLNELDWELDKAGIHSIRYADDSICMCKTKPELEKAVEVVDRVMKDLGLELAPEKTKKIDFNYENFDYLGFTFYHKRQDKNGKKRYCVRPAKDKEKEFKSKIKHRIGKSYSHSYDEWANILNPLIRGVFNYWLAPARAIQRVNEVWKKRGKPESGAFFPKNLLRRMDSYIRQRLRINFANRGKRHARCRDGWRVASLYPDKFFYSDMKLATGRFLLAKVKFPDITIGEFDRIVQNQKRRGKKRKTSSQSFYEQHYSNTLIPSY